MHKWILIRLSFYKKTKNFEQIDVSGHFFKFWPKRIFVQLLQGFTFSSSETLDEDVVNCELSICQKIQDMIKLSIKQMLAKIWSYGRSTPNIKSLIKFWMWICKYGITGRQHSQIMYLWVKQWSPPKLGFNYHLSTPCVKILILSYINPIFQLQPMPSVFWLWKGSFFFWKNPTAGHQVLIMADVYPSNKPLNWLELTNAGEDIPKGSKRKIMESKKKTSARRGWGKGFCF